MPQAAHRKSCASNMREAPHELPRSAILMMHCIMGMCAWRCSDGGMADDLRISLLGSLALERGGVALPESIWRSRQEPRLLGILLTMRGARVPAERLIEWLWPGA